MDESKRRVRKVGDEDGCWRGGILWLRCLGSGTRLGGGGEKSKWTLTMSVGDVVAGDRRKAKLGRGDSEIEREKETETVREDEESWSSRVN